MATNPLGPGKTTITLYVDSSVYIEADQIAGLDGASPAEYAREMLEFGLKNKLRLRKNPEDLQAYYAAIGKPGPKPKVRWEVVTFDPINVIELSRHHNEPSARVAETAPEARPVTKKKR